MSKDPGRILIFDTTLRDGEQSPGASLNLGEKLAIAHQLARLGVDVIERHFTILPEKETRDGLVSITPSQVHELRQFANLPLEDRIDIVRSQIPDWQTYLGSAIRELSQVELLNRDYYRGRFATQQDQDNWLYNWEET